MAQRCNATAKSTGEQCARQAIEGGTVCRVHGGATKKAKAAAARNVARRRAEDLASRLMVPADITPEEGVLLAVQWAAGQVAFWQEQVDQLSVEELTWGLTGHEKGSGPQGPIDKTTHEAKPHIAYVMLTQAQDRLVSYSDKALRAGVAERQVRLAERQGDVMVMVIRNIAAAVLAALRAAGLEERFVSIFQSAVTEAAPRELRRIAGGAA